MKKIVSAGFVIFHDSYEGRKYLLLHYPTGHWDLPKGKVEEGESYEDAALREVYEETGLSVRIVPNFVRSYNYDFTEANGTSVHKTVHIFLGRTDSTHVALSPEHIDFTWLPFEQARDKVTYDNARLMVEKAEEFLDLSSNI